MGNSDFLFARPSFLEGMARTLDLFGTLQEYDKRVTSEQADAWAIFKDFQAVGNDLKNATRQFAEANSLNVEKT